MRVFIAFPVGELIKDELNKVQRSLQLFYKNTPIAWSPVENAHITVEFLGDISPQALEATRSILAYLTSGLKEFWFQLDDLDFFPHAYEPKVLIIKAEEKNSTISKDFYSRLRELLRLHKVIRGQGREWRPHITLGRIKINKPVPLSKAALAKNGQSWLINKILLLQSDLTPNGAIHKVIETYSLCR